MIAQPIVSRSQEPGVGAANKTTSDPVQAAVAALSKEELQEVLDNEVAFEKLLLSIDFPPLDSITENIKSMQEVITVTAQTNITLETEIETLRDALLCKVEEYHTKKLSLGQTAAKVKMLQSRVEGGVLADQLVRLSVDNEEKSGVDLEVLWCENVTGLGSESQPKKRARRATANFDDEEDVRTNTMLALDMLRQRGHRAHVARVRSTNCGSHTTRSF